ncbi:hypothetical protein EWM64_g3525 [Hericium alpestre]|uniref:ARID domain-containing protein n=1 Tax=Hericium alpestre TaxID=135208 RepID=A0A4Z0A3Q0_9AGAM|nr:hypothetical protein EWM64_g3525 [Hericium alpestre]
MPPNFNPALMSQQGQPQPQSQQQVDAQTTIGGLTNPEHGRMWQQMQQQFNTSNGDMMPMNVNPQMADFLRNQNLRMNAQMGQQPFNLAPGSLQSSSSQGFHESPHGQQMPPNFSGVGNAGMAQPQATFHAARNQGQPNGNALMQALQAQGNPMSRQFELMVAHNQQAQNGPMGALASRMGQQPHPQQPGPQPGQMSTQSPGMFPHSTGPGSQDLHSSPNPAPLQVSSGMQAQHPEQANPKMGLNEFTQTLTTIKQQIHDREARMSALSSDPASMSNPAVPHQIQILQREIENMRGIERRVLLVLNKQRQDGSRPKWREVSRSLTSPLNINLNNWLCKSIRPNRKVTKRGLWPAIGARLGWVQFPGSETEPPRSSPTVAKHLEHVYQTYLAMFDGFYVNMFVDARRKNLTAFRSQQPQQQQPPPPQASPQQPPVQQQNMPNGQTSMQTLNPNALPTHVMNTLISYAHTSEADMRRQGLQEPMINFVELHREQLKRTLQSQQEFRGGLGARNKPGMGGLMPPQNGQPSMSPSQQPGQPPQMNQASAQQQQRFGLNSGMQSYGHAQGPQQSMPSQTGMPVNMNGVPGQSNQPTPAQLLQMQQMNMNGMNMAINARFSSRMPGAQQQQPVQQRPQPGMHPTARRPTEEQLKEAINFINGYRQQWLCNKNLDAVNIHMIPEAQRVSYNEALERLVLLVGDLEQKLPMLFTMIPPQARETHIKKLIVISITAKYQRQQCSMQSPRYILDLNSIRSMYQQVLQANTSFAQTMLALSGNQGRQPPSGPPLGPSMQHPVPQPQTLPVPQHPPQAQPAPSTVPPAPQRQVPISQPANRRKPPQTHASGPSASTPAAMATPPAAASTPTAQVATPSVTAASPQTPKSPKAKVPPKPKPTPRRKPSKAAPLASDTASTPAAETPVESKAEPMKTDVKAETKSGGAKRPREEETPGSEGHTSPPSAPSPKRIKSEWDGPPCEAVQKRKEEVENTKTDEEAIAFLEQMQELIKMATAGEGQESTITSDISESLDAILGSFPDLGEPSMLSVADHTAAPLSPPSTSMPVTDPLIEFFDFSSYPMDDDAAGSKAPTPDLVAASSTNPSPGSGSETDAAAHPSGATGSSPRIADARSDDFGDVDLRLGPWKEIDGGESAYYQGTDWKWDQPMPQMDWAIRTS